MKKTEDMSYDELVAEALASPARAAFRDGVSIETLKADLEARALERNEERQIVDLALGYLDDASFFEGDPITRKFELPDVGA